ncbi:hypothetical protein [Streptomyces sp. NPDC005251]|uniref:hypothetical protein n=1 Tax=unclassified Streptomyces TaxID=2593676 RepID=UPI0033BC4432
MRTHKRLVGALGAALALGALAAPAAGAATVHPMGTSSYQRFTNMAGGFGTHYFSTKNHYAGYDAQTCVAISGYTGSVLDRGYAVSLRAAPSRKALWVSPTYFTDRNKCSPWKKHKGSVYTRITTYSLTFIASAKVWIYTN